jgi:hypothetical protein
MSGRIHLSLARWRGTTYFPASSYIRILRSRGVTIR